MTWQRKEFPTIPGYESKGDNVRAKRWLDFKLNQLLTSEDPVWEFRDEFDNREGVVAFVLVKFAYPLKRGKPCDKHYKNEFGCNACHTISADYWANASETLRTLRLNQREDKKGYGDCEDTSVLLVDLFLEKGWKAYEVLGKVYRGDTLLGGHGFSLCSTSEGEFKLVESTLDRPKDWPDGYPTVDPSENDWKVGNLTYHGDVKFNRKVYMEWEEESMDEYLEIGFDEKNKKEKFEAIQEAFDAPVSPIEQMSWLSWLRWRK